MLTYIYFEVKVWVTLIIWKYDTHASNSLWNIRQSHWTMKYRSHRPTFILRSKVRSYWPLIPKYDVHTSNSLQDVMQNHWTIKYVTVTYIYFEVKLWVVLTHIPNNNVQTSNSLQDIRQNHWTMEYRSQWPTLIFSWLCWGLTSQSTIFQSYRDGAIASWVINQYFRGVKCLAQGHNTAAVGLEPRTSRSRVRHSTTEPPRSPTLIFRSNVSSYRFILPKYDVHTSKSLQDIRQNHWTMKYTSQWPIFILRSKFGSYRLIIPNNIVHTSNSLQDIRQNYWTMEYRSQ